MGVVDGDVEGFSISLGWMVWIANECRKGLIHGCMGCSDCDM